MSDAEKPSDVAHAARAILDHSDLLRCTYVEALLSGRMSLEGFRRTQEQFYFAVEFYPRPMAALVSRIPEAESRIDILRNLVEEHGEFDASAFHKSTFQRFLISIGCDPARLASLTPWPEVRAFNCVLAAACGLEDPGVGMGCMGIIELAFANISAEMGRGVVKRGWVRREDLVHYSLHAELDIRHAEDFFKAAGPLWRSQTGRVHVQAGLELGAHVFGKLYEDLAKAALTPPAPSANRPT